MSRAGRALLLALIALAAPVAVTAQANDAPPADEESTIEVRESEPPAWARDLRRAEIVATGTLPLTLLASRLTYSLVRFAVQSVIAGGVSATYAPWFLAPPGSPDLTTVEKLGVVGGAVGLSGLIAIIDYRRGRAEAALQDE
jgi:hypothetical protein